MKIKSKAMGEYQTNCYIVETSCGEFIIDPGMGAVAWVMQNVSKPVAILNTHGHFDHVWSNAEISQNLKIPIYCPQNDVFMLSRDPFGLNMKPSIADFEVDCDSEFLFDDVRIKFHFFPGHAPGCSAIEVVENGEQKLFCGDFIFQGSIGRVDFPYSNPEDMIKSIEKIMKWERDIEIYPGHGSATKLSFERKNLSAWLGYLNKL